MGSVLIRAQSPALFSIGLTSWLFDHAQPEKGPDFYESVLHHCLDIEYLPLRSVGAAFGWLWNTRYEQEISGQVRQLLLPVAEWMLKAGLEGIKARSNSL